MKNTIFDFIIIFQMITSRSQAEPGNEYLEALPLSRQAEPARGHYKAEPCNEVEEEPSLCGEPETLAKGSHLQPGN